MSTNNSNDSKEAMPTYSAAKFFGEDIIYIVMMFAIPVHLLVIATFIKFRKTTFAASYFTLACSVLFSDAFMCVTTIVFNLVLRTPLGPGITINGTETIIDWDKTLSSSIAVIFRNVNQWALLIIAINRFIFVCFPIKANQIWKPWVTWVCLVVQWAIGLLFGAVWRPSMMVVRDPNTGAGVVVPNVDEGKLWSAIIGVSNFGTIIIICILYISMFCVVRAHAKRMSSLIGKNSNQQQNNGNVDIKLAVQAVIYSFFLVPQVVMSVLMIVLPAPPAGATDMPVSMTTTYISNHVTYANYYSTSFIMLVMTKTIRQHVYRFITGKKAEITKTDNRVASMTRGGNQLPREIS